MLISLVIQKWQDSRDSSNRVCKGDLPTGRTFLLNVDRIGDITAHGTGSRFYFSENTQDSRENNTLVETDSAPIEILNAINSIFLTNSVTLPIYINNDPSRATIDTTIAYADLCFAHEYNPAPNDACWVVYIKEGFKRTEALCHLSLTSLTYNTTGEMKYLNTITLNAGVDTVVTTTLTNPPYSVQLLDSSGNDISSTLVSITLVGGVYVLTFYSVDLLTGCKLYILY